jgi:hypothetical protein
LIEAGAESDGGLLLSARANQAVNQKVEPAPSMLT